MNALVCLILLVSFLIARADYKTYIIPPALTLILGITILTIHWMDQASVGPYLFSALFMGLTSLLLKVIMRMIKGYEALGMGDVKLMTVLGLGLEPGWIPVFLIAAGTFGFLTNLIWARSKFFPFAPSLVASFSLVFMYLRL